MTDNYRDPNSPVASTDYQVYKVWFSRPGFPDHVTIAIVASHHRTQDHGTLYHIVDEEGSFRRRIDTECAFQLEERFLRKEHVFGMAKIEYGVFQQACEVIPLPNFREYATVTGPEDWVDRVLYKYQNEIDFQRLWKTFQQADSGRVKEVGRE